MYRCGYVTRERYFRAAAPKIAAALDEWCECEYSVPTYTTVRVRPEIIVSADFQRGIPCS